MSTIYRRADCNWISGKGAKPQARYWRKQAREAFSRDASLEAVEVVHTGCKLDSALLRRGDVYAPPGWVVIVASTGGKWGKSRRDFSPAKVG